MANFTWSEVQIARDENRRELTLQGSTINRMVEKSGLDDGIFTLTNLNLLKIAGTPLETISDELGALTNLTSLLLENNNLIELPHSIGRLTVLKSLDISGNNLESLPDSISELVNIQSLNANLNRLSSFPDVSKLTQLSYLSISRNCLSALPGGVCDPKLTLLSSIDAATNALTSLPADLVNLPHLIKLNVADNKLDALPLELCECQKLKELCITGNNMKDRKLLKLSEHSTKSLLNYLHVQLEKQKTSEDRRGKKEKTKRKEKKRDKKEIEDLERDVMSVLQFEDGLSISATEAVMHVRQYLVCCVIRNLDFNKSNNMFKRFIHIQTKLHETVCDKRQSATIATHDLRLVKQPLAYDALLPQDIQITPLFKSKITTAEVLMRELREEAEAYRKEKKRSTLSGIHKYLDLLKDKAYYPCLRDADGDVISFPPITNSEKTKMTKDTTDVLLEVTSAISLDICKKVMEEMLLATLLTGVGTPAAKGSQSQAASYDGEGKDEETEEVDTSRMKLPQSLTVEQVKVVDDQGNLRVIYPSRIDLQNPAFNVVRNYE